MRCYRVDEQAVVGIPLSSTGEGLHIEVGDERRLLDPHLAKGIKTAKEAVLKKIRECLYTGKIGGQSVTEEEVEELMDMEEQAEDELSLMHADVEEDKIVRERVRTPKALVLIETAPGIGGKIKFKSTSFTEHYDEGEKRVKRKYREDFPPPGVRVLTEGKSGERGRCLLLEMLPGASFRIERTGTLDGAPGVLTVVWKGQKGVGGVQPLEVYSPSRGRGQPEVPSA